MKCSQYNVKVFEVGIDDPATFLKFLEANQALLGQHLLSIQGELTDEIYDFLESNGLYYVLNMRLPQAKRGTQHFKMLTPDEEEGSEEKTATKLPKELAEVREWLRRKKSEKSAALAEASSEEEPIAAETAQSAQEPAPQSHAPAEAASTQGEEDEASRIPPLKVVKRPLRSGQSVEYDGSLLLTERINSGARVAALGSVIALGPVEGDISSVGECVVVPPIRRGTLLFHGRKIENDELIHPLNKVSFVEDHIVVQPINKKEFH